MGNNRVFYATSKVGVAPTGSNNYETLHGIQTMGVTTTFNLEQVFEMGMLAIYENVEGIPDIEVTMDKVMDGYPPIFMLATQGRSDTSLLSRSKQRCIVGALVYPDDEDVSASRGPQTEVHMSGLYVSSFGYEVTVDGNATESVTLVGNNRLWLRHGGTAGTFDDGTHWDGTSSITDDTDRPFSIEGSGGVNRRESVLFGANADYTILPTEIPGVDSNGYLVQQADGSFPTHVQRIAINVDLGREPLFELGRKGSYHRYATFPVEVTTEIGIISVSGDIISATEEGYNSYGGPCGSYNLTDHTIQLALCEGLKVYCGTKNKLASVGTTGAGTDGGNQEITYTYSNFNVCTVTHPRDPG